MHRVRLSEMPDRNIGRIFAPILSAILGLAAVLGPAGTETLSAQASDSLALPFEAGETWYVCQGYNGVTHNTVSTYYALDLNVAPDSWGSIGCKAEYANASTGRAVLAPASGEIVVHDGDGMCINLDSGKSVFIGHMSDMAPLGRIERNKQIGKVAPPWADNNYYAHIHMQVHLKHGCARTSSPPIQPSVPFDDDHGTRFEGADNLPDLGDEVSQHAGTRLTKPAQSVDVALIIDSSGSMRDNDPHYKRLEAARTYLGVSFTGDRVAVIDFDTTARLASGLLEALVGNKVNPALSAAIATIDSYGSTNMRQGIEIACQELVDDGLAPQRGAILLTDGHHNQGTYDNPQECFTQRGWPIFTFGFGDADWTLLEAIANETGGEYKPIENVTSLVCEFQRVRALIAGDEPSPCAAHHVNPGVTTSFTSLVPSSRLQATFSSSWVGSDVVMTLTAPSGRIIDRSTIAPDVVHELGAAFEVYSIWMPEAGEWGVSLFGAKVPPEGEDVIFGFTTIAIGKTGRAYLPQIGKNWPLPTPQGPSDDFDGSTLNPHWTWVDPLGDCTYSLAANPGYLRLYAPDGGHDLYQNVNAPRMVQSVQGNFTATTKVTTYPAHNYQGAGLLVWQDEDNYIRLERTLVSGIDMWYRILGAYDGSEIPFSSPTVYLRFERSGDSFTAWYSENAADWTEVSTIDFAAASTLQVGLDLTNEWQDNPYWADFDFFNIGCEP